MNERKIAQLIRKLHIARIGSADLYSELGKAIELLKGVKDECEASKRIAAENSRAIGIPCEERN